MKPFHPEESMRTLRKLAPVILMLALSGGCKPADPGPPNIMPEILGALKISDGRERDAALAKVCRDAADQGSAPAVLMGLPRIEDAGLRDKVAEDCAMILDAAGQTEAAVDVVKLISSESKRDALLAKLTES